MTSAALGFLLWTAPAQAAEPPVRRAVVCDDVREPLTLDHYRQLSEKNTTILQQIYEGLVRFDPEGRIEPALALSWERRDPLRMRFHLRRGVRFHNGEPFTAEAVSRTIERLLDPRLGYPGLGFASPIIKAEVVDPHTVDVLTSRPDGILLNRLAWIVLIYPPVYLRSAGEEALARRPVGTGPFRFERWEPRGEIVLKANGDYWMPGYPKLDELVFRFTPEDKKLAELFAGRLDLVTNVPGTKTLQVQKNPSTMVVKGRTFFTAFVGLNHSTGPFSDIRVRQALNLAVDREALIRYDAMGNGHPLATLSMPGEPGHDPELKPYPYDPKKAKALLKEAGYPKGFSVRSIVNANAVRTAKIIAADLAKIGVEIKPTVSTDAELLERFKDPRYSMCIGGVPDLMAHSYFIQSMMLYSRSPYSQGKSPAYDARLEEMVSTVDDARRETLARALDRYVYEQALGVFTYQRVQTHAVRKGLRFTPYVTGMPHFFALDYEPDATR